MDPIRRFEVRKGGRGAEYEYLSASRRAACGGVGGCAEERRSESPYASEREEDDRESDDVQDSDDSDRQGRAVAEG